MKILFCLVGILMGGSFSMLAIVVMFVNKGCSFEISLLVATIFVGMFLVGSVHLGELS